MARANRHFIPGFVWHITHRCHKQEFLLKFARDRERWVYWLFEAKKRFGLCVLNYTVTSNHILLLVVDTGKNIIPKSIQLIAGRTAQEFNQRKKRKGAFWEDRYHAVAIETEKHLVRCLVYIDLNMVRAGVVKHPSQWQLSGYNEIQLTPERYRLIDQKALMEKCGGTIEIEEFKQDYRYWVEESMNNGNLEKDPAWSRSIAIGTKVFVEETKKKLGYKAKGRKIVKDDDMYTLREPKNSYNTNFEHKNSLLRLKNTYNWNAFIE